MMDNRSYSVFLVCLLMCCVHVYCKPCPGKVYANKNCSTSAPNTPSNECSLESDDEMKKDFLKTLQKKPDFVFLRLHFEPPFNDTKFQYLSHTYDHIDPLLWFWAHGEKGRFLLQLPVTFQKMSLGSLTPGVYTSHLGIIISNKSCPHFNDLCDQVKLQVISQHIFNVTEEVDSSLFDQDTIVCQDKAFDVYGRTFNNFLATHGFDYLVMYQSETECWSFNGVPLGAVVSPHWLSTTAVLFAVFIIMFYLLSTQSLIRKNPPIFKKKAHRNRHIQNPVTAINVTFIGKLTEISVGIKHILLHTRGTLAKIIRGFFGLCIIILIMFPSITVRNILDDSLNESSKRWQAFFRMDYVSCVHYTWFKLMPFIIVIWGCFEVFYLRNGEHYLLNILKNNHMEKNWPVLNLSIFTHENSETKFDDSCGMIGTTGIPRDFAMRQLNTVLDLRQFIKPYHNIIQYWENKYVGIVLCVFYYIVFLLPMWIMSFPGLDPLRRLMVRVFQFIFNLLRSIGKLAKWVYSNHMSLKDELKTLWPNGVDDILNIIRLAALFNLSLRFLAFVYLLAEVAVHALSGIVLNPSAVTSYFILILFFVGFTFEAITSIHDTYYDLLCTMVDIVFEMKEEQPLVEFIPAELWHRDTSGQNLILEEFFWAIADICKPLRIVVASALMKIFLLGLFVATTVSLLNQVHSNNGSPWPDVLAYVISFGASVSVAILFKMMSSKADKQRRKEILCSQIRKEITEYVLHNQFDDRSLLDALIESNNYGTFERERANTVAELSQARRLKGVRYSRAQSLRGPVKKSKKKGASKNTKKTRNDVV